MFNRVTTLKSTSAVVSLLVLCILIVVAAKGYFRFDDFAQLWENQFKVIGNPSKIITEQGWNGHYRPMEKLFFFVNYLLFGLKPLGYFIVLIAVFLLTQYMFFLLVRSLSGNVLAAYSSVFFFLLQGNLYLYTVGWISAASTILSGLFGLMSFLFYVKSTVGVHRVRLYYFFSLVSFCLGLLSKESIIVFLALFIAYDFLFLWLEAPSRKRLIGRRLAYHVPFWVLLVAYVFVRGSVAGARALTGGDAYAFTLGSNVLDNIIYYGMQLGFLPIAMFLVSLPALFFDRLQLERRDFKLIALGIFLAISAILPLFFFSWHSPTWTYFSAFGTTLASAILFKRVFGGSSRKNMLLLYCGTLMCALVGNVFLFSQLNQARWWQWGTYSKNIIEQVQAHYPDLPPGARLFFIDKNPQKPYGVKGLFRSPHRLECAFQVWYVDRSLHAYIVDQTNPAETILEAKRDAEDSLMFVFEYDQGTIIDKTNWLRERKLSN